MRSARGLILIFALLHLLAATAAAGPEREPAAEVRAILFHGSDCETCPDLFAYLLPGLLEQYGSRLEIAGIDLSRPPGSDVYREAAGTYALPAEWTGEPVVLVNGRTLVGVMAIAQTLGDNFEQVGALPGASAWPGLPGLSKRILQQGVAELRARVAREGAPSVSETFAAADTGPSPGDRIANALAIVVLAGMVAALAHSLVRVRRSVAAPPPRGWLPIVLLAGLGISVYTAYTALAGVAPVCGPLGGCAVVQNSEHARPFGIPMGVWGVLGYGLLLAAWGLGRRLAPDGGGVRWVPWLIAFCGTLFSIWLTALEPFVIGATCLWCLGSAIAMTLALWLLSGETRKRSV
jgi:uncharacterized membrane protein